MKDGKLSCREMICAFFDEFGGKELNRRLGYT